MEDLLRLDGCSTQAVDTQPPAAITHIATPLQPASYLAGHPDRAFVAYILRVSRRASASALIVGTTAAQPLATSDQYRSILTWLTHISSTKSPWVAPYPWQGSPAGQVRPKGHLLSRTSSPTGPPPTGDAMEGPNIY